MIKKFEPIDQYNNSELGLKANGDDLQQLYYHATIGMLRMISDVNRVKELTKIKVQAQGANKEETLVNFLNAVLDQVNNSNMQFATAKIVYADLTSIEAELQGEEYNHNKHDKKGTIKRVIFRDVAIKKTALEVNGPLVWHTELHFAV
jgi:SHS2 domain-containing protein